MNSMPLAAKIKEKWYWNDEKGSYQISTNPTGWPLTHRD